MTALLKETADIEQVLAFLLFGDGCAACLVSAGALAAEHIRQGSSPAAYLAAARRLTGRTIRLASAVLAFAATGVGRSVLLALR